MNLQKILCLHGFAENKTIMIKKTKSIKEKLEDKVEFVYISAPYQVPNDHPFVASFYKSINSKDLKDQPKVFEPFFSWFPSVDNGEQQDYISSIPYICKILKDQGPFAGIMGFSQGAALTVILAKLLEINHPLIKSTNHPPLKFCIIYSGSTFSSTYFNSLYDIPINTPSLHFYCIEDNFVAIEDTNKSISRFVDPITIEHPFGHDIPSTLNYTSIVLQFINSKLNLITDFDSNL